MGLVEELLEKLRGMSPEEREKLAKFTAEKRPIWFPIPGPQGDAASSMADELFYGGSAGGGKDLCNQTLTPVPLRVDVSGFKKHGDLRPGDFVYAPDGTETEVLFVTEERIPDECYKLVFDSGETIVANAEHRWVTWNEDERLRALRASDEWRAKRRSKRKSRAVENSKKPWVSESITRINREREHDIQPASGSIRTTAEIRDTLISGVRHNHSIDLIEPIAGAEADLPIPPYWLGLWLGDGFSASPAIGMDFADWPFIEKQIIPHSHEYVRQATENRREFRVRRYKEYLKPLRALGALHNKHIPPLYLRSSVEDRWELLRGLLDTDGSCTKNGQIECGFSHLRLSEGLQELVSSLGIRSSLHSRDRSHLSHKTHYRIKFMCGTKAFHLPRKFERQKLDNFRPTVTRRYVTDVERVPSVPMRCIKVAHPSGMYCVTRSFIATHNTDLLVGLSLTAHKRTLLLRRTNKEASKLFDRYLEILGSRDGWNGQDNTWRLPGGRVIDIGGCQLEDDKQKYKGSPHDAIFFDEASDFSESIFRFVSGWNRSADQKQRCRIICAGNPPTQSDGLWVIKYWGPWLDDTHPNPAKPGELRWFTTIEGQDREVDGPGPHKIGGELIRAKSRTFIPARLDDNPYLSNTDYNARLAALPEPLRSAYKDGRLNVSIKDSEFQVIPTTWILAAEARWHADGWKDKLMSAMGYDPAGGGADSAVLCWRHGAWFAPLVSVQGAETADGSASAATIIKHRRHDAPVVVDCGGGYGGAVTLRLKDNGIEHVAFNGAHRSTARTKDGKLEFANKRAEVWWKFREELDPDQEGGSVIALPPDPELRADLAAPTFAVTSRGIVLESKDKIRARLGRSPDKGDACVTAMAVGNTAIRRALGRQNSRSLPEFATMRSGPLSRYRKSQD